MKIKNKIISMLMVSLIATIGIGLYSVNSFNLLKSNTLKAIEMSQEMKVVILEISELENQFLMKEKNSMDFHESGESKSHDDIKVKLAELRNLVNEVYNHPISKSLSNIEAQKGLIQTHSNDYERYFTDYVEKNLEKGYGNKNLVGAFENSINLISDISDPQGFKVVITARTYLNNPNETTEVALNKSISAYKKAASINDVTVLEKSFENLLKINNVIGLDETGGLNKSFEDALKLMEPIAISLSDEILEISRNYMNQVTNRIIILIAITVLVMIAINILLIKSIIKPLSSISKAMANVATGEGDLTSRLDDSAKDELAGLAKNFNLFIAGQQNIIRDMFSKASELNNFSSQLKNNTGVIKESSNEVSLATEDLALAASEQATDVENSVEKMTDLGRFIDSIRASIADLMDVVNNIEVSKNEGINIVASLVDKTSKSEVAFKNVYENILETDNSVKEITTASQMIKNISEQTNLLALNASIEAARAGDQGRGFAVVAEEIRKLAEESDQFTDRIFKRLDTLTKKVNESLEAMVEVDKIVKEQRDNVDGTESIFNDIAKLILVITSGLSEVVTSSEKMNVRKDEIIIISTNLVKLTESNASSTEEVSSSIDSQRNIMNEIDKSAYELSGMAVNITETINKFKF